MSNLDSQCVKDIKFIEIKHLNGPNRWTYYPALEATVDIGELEDFPSDKIPGFYERLSDWLPSLIEHRCSYEERGGFLRRVKEGTWPCHILEIVAAARAAHAHEFILRLPHGYDSLVGERGQALSGGERQRISIARALLINPRILILDEATSSVDTTTEKDIQQALDNLVRGRTTIAIAHRLSTLREASRLIVLDRGKIVEIGSHAELMAREGYYYRLYQAQARNVDTEDRSFVVPVAEHSVAGELK